MKTVSASKEQIDRTFFLVDLEGQIVGRTASKIARILMGKHKPTFTPHVDTGDYVVAINAEHIRLTGNKEAQKKYWRHTLYPGGERSTDVAEMRAKKPEEILKIAVKGMLPKGPLGRVMFKKLKVYSGPNHPHVAQKPQPLAL